MAASRFLAPLALLAALPACSGERGADDDGGPPDVGTSAGPGAVPGAGASSGDPVAANDNGPIPAAFQGRWGLVPGDCASGRGDAKGLLEISPDMLTFYESEGRLSELADRTPTRIRARFAFTGEGMEWTRDMVFELKDGGAGLIRSDIGSRNEAGEGAQSASFRYDKCK